MIRIFLIFASIFYFGCFSGKKTGMYRYAKWNNEWYWKSAEHKADSLIDSRLFGNPQKLTKTWDGITWSTWAGFALGGVAWGAHEAFHADPYIYEKRWGFGQYSFWGSEGSMNNYYEKNVERGHKPDIWNWTRDVKHTSYFTSKTLMVSGTFIIAARKGQPIKFRVVNGLLGLFVHSVSATFTQNLIRHGSLL